MALGMKVELNTEDNVVIASIIDRDNNNEVLGSRAFEASRIAPNLVDQNSLYGLSKLLQDRTSDKSVKEHGLAKLDFMEDVLVRLESGEWAAERKVGAPTVSPEVEALAAIKGVTIPVMQKSLRAYTAEQRAGILAHETVIARAAEIKAEREGTEAVDLADMI